MNPYSSSLSSSSSKRNRNPNSFEEHEPSCKRAKNDVFMNFSFEDIGKSFISHLQGALTRNSFSIFDHTMLCVGQNESSELLKAIEESEIDVIVFSANYAFSIRCLDELVDIMDCRDTFDGRKVFPIYYKVQPSDVRNQRGLFKGAYEAHETIVDPERVQKWKQALKDVGQLSGLTLLNGDEEKFIRKIVKMLVRMQNRQELYVTKHPVGIGSRAEELISKLRLDCKDVLVVAVFGVSGIGKTTIAKATYNRIAANFDLSCFLGDIRYHCRGPSWKVDLPKVLISCLTQNDRFYVMGNHNEGVTKIKRLISHRKVLLVLDGIDHFQQLEALGVDPASFYSGSRIIVTTSDKQSLGNIPHESYHTMLLNRKESFTLFTRLMSARDDPMNTKFVKEVVGRAGGLPLVLKVWSLHFKQYEREQWPNILETLKKIPHGDVQKQLQMSYDSLPNRSKKLFLDIACFFDGMEKDLVVKVLQDKDSAFFPDNEFRYLHDKGLLTIESYPTFWMHGVIREMGQEIVRQENEDEPEQRTRLWDNKDVMHVLTECSGTPSVESITLDSFGMKEKVIVDVETIRKMKNLRLIRLENEYLCWSNSSYDETKPFSFKKLKFMEWYGFPFKSINIDMSNLVVLRLQHSRLEKLWEGVKSVKKLPILEVNSSTSLMDTGDFYGLENLEELRFHFCHNLEELHNSIGCLRKLAVLDLRNCTRLRRFPWEVIGKLQSLRQLILDHCRFIGLESTEVMEFLLSSLKECHITRLGLEACNIVKISDEIGSLRWLKHLDVSSNRFPSLPESLELLHELETIVLTGCRNMHSIPKLPPNLRSLTAQNCTSLVNLPSDMSELKFLEKLYLDGCSNLGPKDPECFMKLTGLQSLRHLNMESCGVSQVPEEIENMWSLEELNLSYNSFSSLPDSFNNLSCLRVLKLEHCDNLELLPLLPPNLKLIEATYCSSLEIMPLDSTQMSYTFRTKVCKESSPFTNRLKIYLSETNTYCCSYQNEGHQLSFVTPLHLDKKIHGMILYISTSNSDYEIYYINLKIHNKTNKTSHDLEEMEHFYCSTWVIFYPLDDTTIMLKPGDVVVVEILEKVSPVHDSVCGISLVYEDDIGDSKIVIPAELTTDISQPDVYDISSSE